MGITDALRSGFSRTFWVANVLELFERFAYYSSKAVLAVFLAEQVGLGPTTATFLAGSVFNTLLYFLPVLAGTVVDRFGFKRSLMACFSIFAVGYFMIGLAGLPLGQPVVQALGAKTWVTLALVVTAIGGSLIKPSIVGTVARTTTKETQAFGYSIYYTLVNVGGAIGPLLAPIVRESLGIAYVLVVSSITSVVLFAAAALLYREPERPADAPPGPTFATVLIRMLRLLLCPVILLWHALMLAVRGDSSSAPLIEQTPRGSGAGLLWRVRAGVVGLWNAVLLVVNGDEPSISRRRRLGNQYSPCKFLLFLVIFSGFWAMFWHVFYALPFYVKDFLKFSRFEWIETVDAIAIIVVTIPATAVARRLRPLAAMVLGFVLATACWFVMGAIPTLAGAIAGLIVFAIGEGIQSPRFYEYVASLAPPDQVGTYMGFAFLPIAIGTFIAGWSSGYLVSHYVEGGNPLAPRMWFVVGSYGIVSTVLMVLYDRFVAPKRPAGAAA